MILLSQVYYYKSSKEPAAAAEKGNLICSSHPQEWLCCALFVLVLAVVVDTQVAKRRRQINFQLHQQLDLTCHVPAIASGDVEKRQGQADVSVSSDGFKFHIKPHLKKQHKRRKKIIFCAEILNLERGFCSALIFLAYGLLFSAICCHLPAYNAMQPLFLAFTFHLFFFQICCLQMRSIFVVCTSIFFKKVSYHAALSSIPL